MFSRTCKKLKEVGIDEWEKGWGQHRILGKNCDGSRQQRWVGEGVVLDSRRQEPGAALLKPHMAWLCKENVAATQWTPRWPQVAVLRDLRTGSLTLS